MKKLHYLLIIAITLIISSFSACENDEPDPNHDDRDDIAIKWKCDAYEVTGSGSEFAGSYDVLIKKSTTAENEVILTNFHNWGDATEATAILTGNTLTFKAQTITGYNLSGDGTISDNLQTITWEYTLDDGVEVLNYTATFAPSAVSKKAEI